MKGRGATGAATVPASVCAVWRREGDRHGGVLGGMEEWRVVWGRGGCGRRVSRGTAVAWVGGE
jgi:hypothetical protein